MTNEWILDYDGALYMYMSEEQCVKFTSSAFYKINLKRYVKECIEGFIRFKPTITYIEYVKIKQLLYNEALKNDILLNVGDELIEYINKKDIYIKSRYKLGCEIKKQDEKLLKIFNKYKDIVDNNMTRKLRDKQMWDSFFMYSMRKSGNFSVPGSGKTSSVFGVYSYLKYLGDVRRIIVISPINAFSSWIDEFNTCFDGKEKLKYINIKSALYRNKDEKRKALLYDSGKANLILINYDAVRSLMDEIENLIDNKTLLVFDEVHKVKRIEGETALNVISIAKSAKYLIAMTGTPIPNSYCDIYNFLHILFPDEYNSFFGFNLNMLKKPNYKERKKINEKLQPFFCRTTKQQLKVPEANKDKLIEIKSSRIENELFSILKMKYKRNKLTLMIRILQLETDPKLLLNTLNISDFKYILNDSYNVDEIDFYDYSAEVKDIINECKITTKMKRCLELIEDLIDNSKTVIVWCIFVESIKRLERELLIRGVSAISVSGEVDVDERQVRINMFKEGKYKVLITNPHTLAESISLHKVCHDAIYYEYSYNLVHLLQSKDRIHRLGLADNQYTQYYYLQNCYDLNDDEFSIGNEIYQRLKMKEEIMLNAIDSNILETMPTTEEELEMIFKKLY